MGSWWHSKKPVVEDCLALDVRRLARQGSLTDGASVGRQTVCNLLSFSLPRFTFSKMSLADLVQM
jgi:hypothetical protein